MIEFVDVIVGLSWGDEGKGKVSSFLANQYDAVCRWNGGPNAGHTVYLNNNKYKTHLIPSGVFHGKKSLIGPNCVLNVEKFYQEIDYLYNNGFDASLIKVHPKTHIITQKHIDYDLAFLKPKLGTTGQGIAPCYADKANRVGILAKDALEDKYIWDMELEGKILCEGAQSVWLDINYGNYPYVTSSETLPYNACSLGFSPKKIRNIIGVSKIYDTKSGKDPIFPETLWENIELNNIIEAGKEFGTTTGRKRLVNYLNLSLLIKSINLSGCNILIINKCDVLESLGIYKLIYNQELKSFKSMQEMKDYVTEKMKENTENIEITFSGDVALI